MNCDEISELLPEYIGGGLSKELRGMVAFHLASCAECRRETALLIKLRCPAELPESVRKSAFALVKADSKRDESVLGAFEVINDSIGMTRAALRFAKAII